MTDAPEADWPGKWPVRVHILHPEVKTYGDMVTAPERREYVCADKVAALVESVEVQAGLLVAGTASHERAKIVGERLRAALAALDAKR
jgi:hypothetical protein